MVIDISERRRAEAAVRASEERYRLLFEMSRDAMLTLAPASNRFTAGNAAAVALFGAADEADLVSRAAGDYSPAQQADGRTSAEKATALIEVALCGGSHAFDWTYRRVSGEIFSATVLFTQIQIDGQTLLQATVRDVTEERRLHANLAQADRLTSMGLLAARVAHEINNPLAAVLLDLDSVAHDLQRIEGFAQRLDAAIREHADDVALATIAKGVHPLKPSRLADTSRRLHEAIECVERIQEITRGLGTFSRVEREQRTPTDLNTAIERAASIAQNEIKYRAQLVKELGVLPAVSASDGRLTQVFLNLLINAAHAIPEGDAGRNRITVRTRQEGDHVIAEVVDTGTGIAGANLDRVFDPFFSTSRAGEGAGLGLAICRNLVTEFGGEISVQSELGKGTCFTVRLPVAAEGTTDAVAPEAPPTSTARGRILVVDDEAPIRRVMERLLANTHDVVTVASGEEGRVLLEVDAAFDLILCDLMMVGMTGMELYDWLAQHNPTLASEVVFMTGGAFTPRSAKYMQGHNNLVIEKPFTAHDLLRLVATRVEAAQKRRGSTPNADA